MALSVVYTRQAEAALDILIEHIESRFSPDTALRVLEDIIDRITDLSISPYTGTVEEIPGLMPNRKAMVQGRTIIRYAVDGEELLILDIFDARTDWKR